MFQNTEMMKRARKYYLKMGRKHKKLLKKRQKQWHSGREEVRKDKTRKRERKLNNRQRKKSWRKSWKCQRFEIQFLFKWFRDKSFSDWEIVPMLLSMRKLLRQTKACEL